MPTRGEPLGHDLFNVSLISLPRLQRRNADLEESIGTKAAEQPRALFALQWFELEPDRWPVGRVYCVQSGRKDDRLVVAIEAIVDPSPPCSWIRFGWKSSALEAPEIFEVGPKDILIFPAFIKR